MGAPERFAEAVAHLELHGGAPALLDAAQAELERRHRWHPRMRFQFAGRAWWMRVTNFRVLVFVCRDDTLEGGMALCQRWHD